jgi:hypothetical protein
LRLFLGFAVASILSFRNFQIRTLPSLLFGTAEIAPEAVSTYVGTLDDPGVFQPEAAMFRRDRHGWDVTAGALTEFETMPHAAGDRE